jgi:hypothetical protein
VPRKSEADRIIDSLSNLEPLEDVPTQVSANFNATLSRLVTESTSKKQKTSWISGANHFALAASFFVVFALGAVVTLNTGTNSDISLVTSNSTNENDPLATDDQLLFSNGADSPQSTPNKPIAIFRSGHDYSAIPDDLYLIVGAGTTWNSPEDLLTPEKSCLAALQLDQVTNTIDLAKLGTASIRAVWSPATLNAWYVYLVDENCNAIDKKFIEKP